MPKVSIIMGIYNCAETLPEAIDSVLTQTFSDWQLILCDDGSKDNTYGIAKEYQGRFPEKILLLQNERNMGLNHTLNRCLQVVSGEYVARMDGDDISLPTRIEKEAAFLDAHPEYAIVSTPMIFFDEHGDWGRSYAIEEPTKRDFIKHSPVHCHAPCMIRREAYLAVGGYTEDRRMLRFEDVNLWYKMFAEHSPIFRIWQWEAIRKIGGCFALKMLTFGTNFTPRGTLDIIWTSRSIKCAMTTPPLVAEA